MSYEILIPVKKSNEPIAIEIKSFLDRKFKNINILTQNTDVSINIGELLYNYIFKTNNKDHTIYAVQTLVSLPENFKEIYTTIETNRIRTPSIYKYEYGTIFIFTHKQFISLNGFTRVAIGWENLSFFDYAVDKLQINDYKVSDLANNILPKLKLKTTFSTIELYTNELYLNNYNVALYPTHTVKQYISNTNTEIVLDIKYASKLTYQRQIYLPSNINDLINYNDFKDSLTKNYSYWLLLFPFQFISSSQTQYNFDNQIEYDNMITPLVTTNEYHLNLLFILFEIEDSESIGDVAIISPIEDNFLVKKKNENEYIISHESDFTYDQNSLRAIIKKEYNCKYILDYHDIDIQNKSKKIKDPRFLTSINSYLDIKNFKTIKNHIKKIDFFRINPDEMYQQKYSFFKMGKLMSEMCFYKIFAGIIIALSSLRKKGILSSVYFSDHPIYIELTCILRNLFEEILIFKSPISVYYLQNHEIICKGFKGIRQDQLDTLIDTWKLIQKNEKDNMIDKPNPDYNSSYERKRYYKSIFSVPKKDYDLIHQQFDTFRSDMSKNRQYKFERVSNFIDMMETLDKKKKQEIIRYMREGQIQIALDLCRKYKLQVAPYYKERYEPIYIKTK